MNSVFRFKTNPGNQSPASYGQISTDEIQRMSTPEFLVFKERLVNVRHRERYDMAVFEAVIIPAGTTKDLFRKGTGQEDTFATSDTEYKKTRQHTNMHRGGEFEQGSLIIITDISAPKAFFSGLPTAVVNGIVTNARATFPAYIDPALALDTWLNCVELDYREGEASIIAEPLTRYAQNSGVSGVIGGSNGGIIQNAFMPSLSLDNPRVLEGGEDFSVRLQTMSPFDASATGVNMPIAQKVVLSTTELVNVRA